MKHNLFFHAFHKIQTPQFAHVYEQIELITIKWKPTVRKNGYIENINNLRYLSLKGLCHLMLFFVLSNWVIFSTIIAHFLHDIFRRIVLCHVWAYNQTDKDAGVLDSYTQLYIGYSRNAFLTFDYELLCWLSEYYWLIQRLLLWLLVTT